MDKRALAEQLLGLPPGSLLGFKIFDDHISLILPDGRKISLAPSELEAFAAAQAATQAGTKRPSRSKPADQPARRQPEYKYRKGAG